MTRIAALASMLLVTGCVTTPRTAPVMATPPMPAVGLERVMGQGAAQLVVLFGEPDQDLRERTGRRLQFAGPVCVLDAYLYPPERGGAAVVTYIDARLHDGSDIDRASCVAALARGKGR